MPVFWYSFAVLIIAAAAIYFLLFFPKFQVQNINVAGNQKINTEEVKNIIGNLATKKFIELGSWNISSKSIFLVDTGDIQNQIASSYPIIKKVTINKKLPQDLNAQIEERSQFATFCQSDKCFVIDEAGVIFEDSPNNPENAFIVRQNQDINELFLGERVVQENLMTTISEIEKNLKDNFQITLTEALISTPIRLDVKTGENWQIYFDIDENSDIGLQLTKLNLLLKDELSTELRQKLEYIDLRFKDRAYYK